MRVEREGDRIRLEPIGWREDELVKDVPGSTWSARERAWTAPLAWPVCLALRGLFGEGIEIGPQLEQWSWQQWRRHQQLAGLRAATEERPIQREGLYWWQDAGVEWLQTVKRGLLGDKQRLGKMIQGLVALRELGPDAAPCLIVAPKGVQRAWLNEFPKWAPDWRSVLLRGSAVQRRRQIAQVRDGEADALIANWSQLQYHSRLAAYGSVALERCEVCSADEREKDKPRKQARCHVCPREMNEVAWKAIVADEVHRAAKPKSVQTRALWWLAQDAEYVWGMSGTPMTNRPDDLWSILHMLDPDGWPRKTQFVGRYCHIGWNTFGGLEVLGVNQQTREEFNAAFDAVFLRRTPDDPAIAKYLPTINRFARFVELSPKERKAYETFRDKLVLQLEDGEQVVGWNPLVKLTRLLQLAQGAVTLDEAGEVQITEPSAKLDGLMEVIEDLAGEPVVVYATHNQLLDLAAKRLEKKGVAFGMITGAVTGDDRDEVVRAFQAGELQVVLGNVAAGGEGITLNRARTLVMLERSPSMVQDEQAMFRVIGLNQAGEQVDIIDLIAEDTAEDRIVEILGEKRDIFEEVARDKSRLMEVLT